MKSSKNGSKDFKKIATKITCLDSFPPIRLCKVTYPMNLVVLTLEDVCVKDGNGRSAEGGEGSEAAKLLKDGTHGQPDLGLLIKEGGGTPKKKKKNYPLMYITSFTARIIFSGLGRYSSTSVGA